jgi:hypothetical protein
MEATINAEPQLEIFWMIKWFTMGQQCLAMFYMQQHLIPKKKRG